MSNPQVLSHTVPNLVQRTKLEHLKVIDINLARAVLQRYTQIQHRQHDSRMQKRCTGFLLRNKNFQEPQQNPPPFTGMSSGAVPAGIGRGQQNLVPGSNMGMQTSSKASAWHDPRIRMACNLVKIKCCPLMANIISSLDRSLHCPKQDPPLDHKAR